MSTAQESKKTVSGYAYDEAKQTLTVWGRVRPNGYQEAKRALDAAVVKMGSADKAMETLPVAMRKVVNRVYDFNVTLTGIEKSAKYHNFVVYDLQSGAAVAIQKYVRELIEDGKTNSEINTALHACDWDSLVPDGSRNVPTKAEKQVRTVQAMTADDIAKAMTPEQKAELLKALQG